MGICIGCLHVWCVATTRICTFCVQFPTCGLDSPHCLVVPQHDGPARDCRVVAISSRTCTALCHVLCVIADPRDSLFADAYNRRQPRCIGTGLQARREPGTKGV